MDEKDLVLAKIKGFPDWPAVVVPVDAIPGKLQTAKFTKCMDNYLKSSDQVCVKFFYDDQYSWTKVSNVKPLSMDAVEAHLVAASDARGGRVKRITEAYRKAKEVDVDEFLEFGSFGKPIEEVEEDLEDLEEVSDVVEPVKKRGRPGRPKKEVQPVAGKKKVGRPKKEKIIESTSEEPDEPEDEILEFVDNEDDEDFEGLEDAEDEDDEDVDEEVVDDDDSNTNSDVDSDADSDSDSNSESSNKKRKLDIGIVSPFISTQPTNFAVEFKDIPDSTALSNEVTEMTNWCANLRSELQTALFDQTTKQATIDEIIEPLVNADLSKSIIKSTKLAQVVYVLLSTPERQSSMTKKLRSWWDNNFDYAVTTDIHWSPKFTAEMHQEEETRRREHVAALRQKRKDERKQSETPVSSAGVA